MNVLWSPRRGQVKKESISDHTDRMAVVHVMEYICTHKIDDVISRQCNGERGNYENFKDGPSGYTVETDFCAFNFQDLFLKWANGKTPSK